MTDLESLLREHPPFDALDADAVHEIAAAARLVRYGAGTLILDAFAGPTDEVWVVTDGRAGMWDSAEHVDDAEPDELLGPGDAFGFSSFLTRRSVGPRVVAVGETTVARLPGGVVGPAFSSGPGARFLAEHLSAANARPAAVPSYGVVDELISTEPLLVDAAAPIADVARLMSEHAVRYAAVALRDGGFGVITDAVLRERVVGGDLPASAPAADATVAAAPTARLGDSAAEAMIALLDGPGDLLFVLDRRGALRGAIEARDFVVSPSTAGISLREQIRRAGTVDELVERSGRLPAMLGDLLARGLASGRVIAVHSATVDAIVRRALTLVLAEHPDLPVDGFTWLALGSNGRREAVPSSDLDAAVAFADGVPDDRQRAYRDAFADVEAVLGRAGLTIDRHGTAARRAQFSRTNAGWRAAARDWLAAPERDNGAIMTSLLVDGRPIHGDPGLPEVTKVFGELREHPGTMRLLLRESLAYRAKQRSVRDVLSRKAGTFDIKAHALLPVINIARWAALSVGSAELATTERLRAAAGTEMLPDEQAATLVEVFEVLQRLRLRHQLAQQRRGEPPGDVLTMPLVSPIDRSVISQAVREIAAVQKRMDNVAAYAAADTWTAPAT